MFKKTKGYSSGGKIKSKGMKNGGLIKSKGMKNGGAMNSKGLKNGGKVSKMKSKGLSPRWEGKQIKYAIPSI